MQFHKFDDYITVPPIAETAGGRQVHLGQPEKDSIAIDDIAHHLALTNRFNGATCQPVSVAYHSFWVADYLYHQTHDAGLALHGLLHDAHEAYLGDLTYPVKCMPAIAKPFANVANLVQASIEQALGLCPPTAAQQEEVKKADALSLAIEARLFMPSQGSGWAVSTLDVEPLLKSFKPSTWQSDKAFFLGAFDYLNQQLSKA